MSSFDPSPSPSPSAEPEADVRTYRGRTVEELVPQIRAELGPGAIILRERQGVTGGLGGFFAQKCVEIDAQAAPRVSVYADDSEDADEELELDDAEYEAACAPAISAAALPEGPMFAARLQQAVEAPVELAVEPPVPMPVEAPVPMAVASAGSEPERPQPEVEPGATHPSDPATPEAPDVFAAFVDDGPADVEDRDPRRPARPADEPLCDALPGDAEPPAVPGFIAFDELGADLPAAQAPEPVATPVPVPVSIEPAEVVDSAPAPPAASVFRPVAPAAPVTEPTAAPVAPAPVASAPAAAVPVAPAPAAPAPDAVATLTRRLVAQGFSPPFAEAAVADGLALASPGGDLLAATRAGLLAALPEPAALPLTGGAIAVVGSGGTGKTRTVAALAAAYARAGHTVTVARLGSSERNLELAELLRGESVEVIPGMRTKATARAVATARERGLVLVDTTSVSPGDRSAAEVLAETLAPFELDGVLLCVPATFTAQASARLVESVSALSITGLVATHVDEADQLGAIAELAIRRSVGLGHAHAGLDVGTAISTLEPGRLAGQLLR